MQTIDALMNERAQIWENILKAQAAMEAKPTAANKEAYEEARADMVRFDEKVNNLFGV